MFARLFKKDKKDKKEKEEERSNDKGGDKKHSKNDKTVPPQEKLTKDDFEKMEILGKGSFAQVDLVRRVGTNNYYAMKGVMKQVLVESKRYRDVFVERDILSRINHPYLLKLYWTFQSEDKVFFVLEYMPGGDLHRYLDSIPSKQLDLFTAKLYGAEILSVILCLHEHSVIYRDLKPENILLSAEGHCVLADFGLAKDFYDEKYGADRVKMDMRANSFVGSPFYVAPDVLKQCEYTNAVDFWSFGILLYRMLCGRTPFNGKSMREVFDNILYSDLRFPSSVQVPPEAKDLISRLLVKEANRRIKGPEVKAHPFWTGISFNELIEKKVKPPSWKPIPPVEQLLAERVNAAGVPSATTNPGHVVSTPAPSSQLSARQQQLFTGFSCTADSHLNNN